MTILPSEVIDKIKKYLKYAHYLKKRKEFQDKYDAKQWHQPVVYHVKLQRHDLYKCMSYSICEEPNDWTYIVTFEDGSNMWFKSLHGATQSQWGYTCDSREKIHIKFRKN